MVTIQGDVLDHALEELESILAPDQAEPSAEWARRYRDILGELAHTIRGHVNSTESPGGALATLQSPKQQTAATLEHAVQNLRLDHIELMNSACELYLNMQRCAEHSLGERSDIALHAEVATARHAGERLLQRLHKHQEAERKLLMDTIYTDVGVGD
jgi:hypothetical protein